MTTSRKKLSSPVLCLVCSDVARGKNYNAITCMSCKTFFRRNCFYSLESLHCMKTNNCELNVYTRRNCRACRLSKCFAVGMDYRLVDCSPVERRFVKRLPTPQTLGLLQNDRSLLSIDQWRLLSNIIQIYDKQNILEKVNQSLTNEHTLPLKLRIKPSYVMNYINQCKLSTEVVLKESPCFENLSTVNRHWIVENNFYFSASFNALLVGREVDLWHNDQFGMIYNLLFGENYFEHCAPVPRRLDSNSTLAKIMLFVILFSSNYSIVTFRSSIEIETIRNSIEIIRIQDVLTEILWKYLIYQYDYRQAVKRYSLLIKSLLDNMSKLEDHIRTEIFYEMLDKIILEIKSTVF